LRALGPGGRIGTSFIQTLSFARYAII